MVLFMPQFLCDQIRVDVSMSIDLHKTLGPALYYARYLSAILGIKYWLKARSVL